MLNSQLDVGICQAEFSENNRILIRDALDDGVADRLLASLEYDIPWQLAYMEKGVPCVFSRERVAAMSPAQLYDVRKKIASLGVNGFQFCYEHYSVSDSNQEQCPEDAYLNAFSRYLQSDDFIGAMRKMTGVQEICRLEILAARYSGGDFLMMHDDTQKPDRRIAFVFNLSRGWQADWGGLTHFLDSDGSVSDTYVPTWNSLLVFKVPVLHLVSCVMPFAPWARYSVTGWLTV